MGHLALKRRTLWVCTFFFLVICSLLGRLWHLQVAAAPRLSRAALAQRSLTLPLGEERGTIRDRRGEPLSDPQQAWAVAVFPALLPQGGERALAAALGLPSLDVSQPLPFWAAEGVDPAAAAAVAAMGLPRVAVVQVPVRYGPGALARHLVGYVNQSGGQLGLEAAFDRWLRGGPGPALALSLDAGGRPLSGVGVRTLPGPPGRVPHDVYTTLDARVQRAAEAVLDRHPGLEGAVVVLRPHSGEVLAAASRPHFDPRKDPGRRPDDGAGYLLSRAQLAYEPGSVFKVVVMAAALQEGVARADEHFFCPGQYDLPGYSPRCYLPEGHGRITLAEALAESCNVVFIQVGLERLGAEKLLQYARAFGLGEPPAQLKPPRLPGEVAQLSFGQGITLAPLQAARLMAALASGGVLPPLRLVQEVRAPDGSAAWLPPAARPQAVVRPAVAAQVNAALRLAVTQGTGQEAALPHVAAAGKTGSAEGLRQGEKVVHAWFAGYFPAGAPRYAVAVFLEGGGSGSQVAAPLFRQVAEALLALEQE